MMNQSELLLPNDFPHEPPEGYEYRVLPFKRGVIAVWTVYLNGFLFNNFNPHYCIWGFYKPKTQQYFAPKNSKQLGDQVDVNDTTPYSAMQLNLNPLMSAFL